MFTKRFSLYTDINNVPWSLSTFMQDLKSSNSISIVYCNVRKVLVSYIMGGKLSRQTALALTLN